MLKKIRLALAIFFWLGITLLLLDFTGALHGWLGWMAKVQFLPAVLALNVGVILALVVLTLVFGRVYCSVICPLGALQDASFRTHAFLRRHQRRRPRFRYTPETPWLRYGVWVLFVAAIIAGINSFVSLLAPYSAWGRIVVNLMQPVYLWINNVFAALSARFDSYAFYPREVWIRSLPSILVAAVTLIALIALAWNNGRLYCNSICPVGTTLSFFSRFAMFRPVIDTAKCKDCKQCERACKACCIDSDEHLIDYNRCVGCFNCIEACKGGALTYRYVWGKKASGKEGEGRTQSDAGRRAFLTGTALAVGAATLKAQEKKVDGGFSTVLGKRIPPRKTPLTPAGSKSVKDFYRRCTACQLCISECPNYVLRPSTDLQRLMQPEMSYEKGYCRPECTRCSEICPSGAIRKISREEKTQYHIGTAHVNRVLCVAEKGVSCGNCAAHCPVGAIQMVAGAEGGNPVPAVDEAKCIGCGACENLCPSRPYSAITVNGRHEHLD